MGIVRARPSGLRGELVNKNCRKEPVCLKCSKGSSMPIVGARPSELRGELVRVSSAALGILALVAFQPNGNVA